MGGLGPSPLSRIELITFKNRSSVPFNLGFQTHLLLLFVAMKPHKISRNRKLQFSDSAGFDS